MQAKIKNENGSRAFLAGCLRVPGAIVPVTEFLQFFLLTIVD
ncbi:hypothetical protein [Paenibacillus periandrae]|nr:hypothetical protein [Paenibacillus periandrae]